MSGTIEFTLCIILGHEKESIVTKPIWGIRQEEELSGGNEHVHYCNCDDGFMGIL